MDYFRNNLRIISCFGLMISMACFGFGASDGGDPKKPKQITIPFTMDRNLILVNATLNGQAETKLIFDTGTSGLTLSESQAKQLELKGDGFTMVGRPNDPNPVQGRNITVPKLSVNGFVVTELAGVAMPDDAIFLPPDVAGILSVNTFEGYLVTIDYARSQLRLRRGALRATDTDVITPSLTEIMEANITVNGKKMPAFFDSGGPETISFPLEWKSELTLQAEPQLFAKARTGSGEVEMYQAQLIGEIKIGSILLLNPRITLVSGGFPAINIGFPFLRDHTLTIDMANRLLKLATGTSKGKQ